MEEVSLAVNDLPRTRVAYEVFARSNPGRAQATELLQVAIRVSDEGSFAVCA